MVFLSEVNKNIKRAEVAKEIENVVKRGAQRARCEGGGNKYFDTDL